YKIIAGVDPKDATTREFSNISKPVKTIGLPKEYFRSESQKDVNKAVLTAAKVYERQGYKIIDVSLFDPKYAIAAYTILQRSEVSSNLARFDGIRYGHDRDFFNEENKRRIILGTYTLQAGYYDAYYKKAQQVRSLIIDDFKKVFESVDLLLAPTMPTIAPKIGVTSGQSMYGELADILTEPSAIAGLPAISIPCGFTEGLPIGLQLIGPAGSEDQILDTAEVYEKQTAWHLQKPKL
ncbi:MAG: amidase, partial [Patescibacteria group bacterium]